MKKVNENKVWSSSKVMAMCVHYGYYTFGDNEAYGKMLEYVRTHKPTTAAILEVAKDIVVHSTTEDGVSDELILEVMYELANEVVTTCYTTED